MTILGPEVFSTVSSQFEYEESEKTMTKSVQLAKPENIPNFGEKLSNFGKVDIF